MLRRRIRIGSRSVSLATLLLLVTVISVAAWGVFMVLQARAEMVFNVDPAPDTPQVDFEQTNCFVTSGSGIATPSWDPVTLIGTCSVDEFNEDTVGHVSFRIHSMETVQDVDIDALLPASTACVNFSWLLPPVEFLTPDETRTWNIAFEAIPGPEGTITCAGTQIGPFATTFDLALIP